MKVDEELMEKLKTAFYAEMTFTLVESMIMQVAENAYEDGFNEAKEVYS